MKAGLKKRGAVRKLALVEVEGADRPVGVRLRRVLGADGRQILELEFRPMCSRQPVRVELERLCKVALSQGRDGCVCLVSDERRRVEEPGQLVIGTVLQGGVS